MKTLREIYREIDWKELRRDMLPHKSDMDVKHSLWGSKIRAVRPFILFTGLTVFLYEAFEG